MSAASRDVLVSRRRKHFIGQNIAGAVWQLQDTMEPRDFEARQAIVN